MVNRLADKSRGVRLHGCGGLASNFKTRFFDKLARTLKRLGRTRFHSIIHVRGTAFSREGPRPARVDRLNTTERILCFHRLPERGVFSARLCRTNGLGTTRVE